jgi:antitoxin (DNA-binding transcriptional repressor) of toxin-antitoxin stability system
MEAISIFEAKNSFSALISNIVNKGDSYLICKNGHPVAELVYHKTKDRLNVDKKLKVKINGELFNDDMSEDWECLV